jgi:hypothetical protein
MQGGGEAERRGPSSGEWRFAAYVGFALAAVLLLLAVFLFLYVLLAELQSKEPPTIMAPLLFLGVGLLTLFVAWRAWVVGLETKLEDLRRRVREKEQRS